MKDLVNAEKDINESIGRDPENAWAYRNKGILYLMKEDYPAALRLLKQCLDTDPFVDKVYFYLGMAYLKNNDKKAACLSFRKSEEVGDRMVTADIAKLCK